jgi:hypothetical protein
MKSTFIAICTAAISLTALASEAAAAPRPSPVFVQAGTDVSPVAVRRGFHAVGGVFYYNGHRGVVHARRGYRYHRGYWFPPAAFARPVVVAPAPRAVVVAPAPVARLTAAHIRWCHATYVSYRASDNTYQPHGGPRRQCWSPYS